MDVSRIQISKLEAAKRQRDTAIKMWFADGDPVSIHTLAAAAHQIINDVNEKIGETRAGMPLQRIQRLVRRIQTIGTVTAKWRFSNRMERTKS